REPVRRPARVFPVARAPGGHRTRAARGDLARRGAFSRDRALRSARRLAVAGRRGALLPAAGARASELSPLAAEGAARARAAGHAGGAGAARAPLAALSGRRERGVCGALLPHGSLRVLADIFPKPRT